MSGTLGERIRAAREARELSVKQLARRAGLSEDGLRKIEIGLTKQPAFRTGARIARALGVNAEALALGDENYLKEAEQRSVEAVFQEVERLSMQISALCRLANNLQDQARGVLQRIAQGLP